MGGKLACGVVGALLLLGAGAARASDAVALADRAGFLVGHAYRCGIDEARLIRSGKLVSRLISAYALDDADQTAAQNEFADQALASMLAADAGEKLPSCARIRAQFTALEQHRLSTPTSSAVSGARGMARDNRSAAQPRRTTELAKPAKAATPPTTRREQLTAEQREALELKRIAKRERGRPSSI